MSRDAAGFEGQNRQNHRKMRVDARRYLIAVETATKGDRAGRLVPLARWAAGFGRELHLHHTSRTTTSSRPSPSGSRPAARDLADPAQDFASARERVLAMATELRDLLARHLDIEDDDIVPRFAEAFTVEEFEALDERVKRSIPKRGLSFALPWNVEALDPATRAELIASAPLVLRLVYRFHAPRYARLVAAAFDGVPEPVLV